MTGTAASVVRAKLVYARLSAVAIGDRREHRRWIGAGVSGAVLIALNVGVVAYGFALFLCRPCHGGSVALVQREPSFAVLQGAFTAVNLLGLWRWAGS